MADETTPVTGNEAVTPPGQTTTGEPTPISSLPPDIQTLIHELREESKRRRIEKSEAEAKARKSEEQRLADEHKWQELAEARQKTIDELTPYQQKAELLEQGFNTTLEGRLKTIPNDVRKSLVEPVRATMSAVDFAKWLDANETLLRTKNPPNLEAGAGAGAQPTGESVKLSVMEAQIAQAAGMTPAQYAVNKKKIAALTATRTEDQDND